jgi:iron complex outermembrane receptor protein
MFQNGLSSLTQGVDLTANYPTDLSEYGLIDWTLAANYNQTSVSSVAPVPAALTAGSPAGVSFFPDYILYNFVHGSPPEKIGLTASWSLDDWGVTLRETYYGPEHQIVATNGGLPYHNFIQPGAGLFDAEVRYSLTDALQFAVGGNNLFNVIPKAQPPLSSLPSPVNGQTQTLSGSTGGVLNNPADAPYEPYGGLYYARIIFKW